LEHDGVDSADGLGLRRQSIEQADNVLLERIGNVETGKAELLHRRDDRLEISVLESQHVEIDQAVGIVEIEALALADMHDRGQRRANAPSHQRHLYTWSPNGGGCGDKSGKG